MINVETILVLGAGSSIPYGFPSGEQLVQEMLLKMSSDKYVKEKLKNISQPIIDDLRLTLESPLNASIDILIGRKKSLSEITRTVLADIIHQKEVEHYNYSMLGRNQVDEYGQQHTNEDQWYLPFFDKVIDTDITNLLNSKLTIFTLNYDRSLEYSLLKEIPIALGTETKPLVLDYINRNNIIHINGSLGKLKAIEDYKLEVQAGKIKTIYDEDKEFNDLYWQGYIKDKIVSAKNIIFMGTAYHDLVLTKIFGDPGKLSNKTILGSCFELSPNDRKRATQKWGIELIDSSYKNMSLIKHLDLFG
ncbi:MAG: hypothetical protein UT34_C0002G0072 [candidate division WS6 bacterium GW2011_GWF2_39_15]|uniref:SIR2-like domain-containing protein n=1 Tax=candidate division WS6 bacterium GW2011_GWF2_39_15 TaxID=1619100 RepID=A0A0G0Q577_9BACT|nr:MAG: hypothetical protein UT34_C0002G0072 [candidate division WS6 bacterium GW2011_GWF2_39_15]